MEYTPHPRPTETGELHGELIRNAAFVAYEGRKAKALARWQADDSQRRVVYVFDTDIIVALCAPWRSGPADDEFLGRGYGQILPLKPLKLLSEDDRQLAVFEERRRAEAVCWLLASKAFGRAFDQRMPVLQTGPHYAETSRVCDTVKLQAHAEALTTRTTHDERQSRIFDQVLRFIESNATLDSWPIEGNAGRFLSDILNRMRMRDLQSASRFVRQWDGYTDLVRLSNGIFQLAEYLPANEVLTKPQEVSWRDVCSRLSGSLREKDVHAVAYEDAFRKIVAPSRYRYSRDRMEVDIQALVEVAVANQMLTQSGERSLKVVLITGDKKTVLALAASRLKLRGVDDKLGDFEFNSVHHLWSFVDGITAELTRSRSPSPRSELFAGFLAFEGDERPPFDHTRRLVSCAINSDESLTQRLYSQDVEQAYRKWDDFSESAANLHRYVLTDAGKQERISQVILSKLKGQGQSLSPRRMHDLAVETMARARDRTNVEFSEIGANSILDAHRRGVRNPPDLMFDSLRVTNRIFKDLALPKRVFVDAGTFARRFDAVVEDCYRPAPGNSYDDDYRQECYLKYLVLGSLFASANRWIVTEQHAENAVNIVERSKRLQDPIRTRPVGNNSMRSNMSGREAYYLLAVSKRVRAKGERGYSEAAEALRKARACLSEDRECGTAASVPSLRFDSEALALALSRYYWHRHTEPSSSFDRLSDDIFRKARKLRDDMNVGRDDSGFDLRKLPASTRTNVATNILQVGVVSRFRDIHSLRGEEASPIGSAEICDALGVLLQHTDLLEYLSQHFRPMENKGLSEVAEVICSPLMVLYAVVSAMMVADEGVPQPTSVLEVERLFVLHSKAITEYDEWRFSMLRAFAKGLVKP